MPQFIRETPYENPLTGLSNDVIQGLLGYMKDKQRTQQMQGLASLLESTGIPKTVERAAYAESPTGLLNALTNVNRANVPLLKPETADALMTLAPVPSGTNKAAMAVGRAGERYAEKVVPQIMERGGLPAGLLQDLAQGSRSQIVPSNVAREIQMPVNLPTSKEFIKAVENEPSAQITEEGLLLNLKRLQNPEQSGMESVRTGVFYLPEGQSANLKHYKGKTGYGGAEPIEGETLYKNPLFVKGATGGKAPEVAYDQLNGKGAYEAMRSDVLKSYGYNDNQSKKVESVQAILEKYNGLDSEDAYNMAYNIVSNSKTGNTLPYAIQENIVANSVRNAGHDAVLGYGKGRGDKGEFFSEVFDVREAAYPTKFGDYELMPSFQEKRKKITSLLE
jgi:hypothetical protein